MIRKSACKVISNEALNPGIYQMEIDCGKQDMQPGQFVNVTIPGVYLPRPISITFYDEKILTLIYRVVGEGTKIMSQMQSNDNITIMGGLGNGFNLEGTDIPLVVGGGLGVAPLYYLTWKLVEKGIRPDVILGFKSEEEAFYLSKFKELPIDVNLAYDSQNQLVTDIMPKESRYDYFYACGPKPMLKAVSESTRIDGEVSLEERMACGVGQCKCCSIETNDGMKTLCKDGPVLAKRLVRW